MFFSQVTGESELFRETDTDSVFSSLEYHHAEELVSLKPTFEIRAPPSTDETVAEVEE